VTKVSKGDSMSPRIVGQEAKVHTLEGRLKVMEIFLVDPESEKERIEIVERVREKLRNFDVFYPVRGPLTSTRGRKPTIDSFVRYAVGSDRHEYLKLRFHYSSSGQASYRARIYRMEGLGPQHPDVLEALEEEAAFREKTREKAQPFWEVFKIQAKGSEAQREEILPLLADPKLDGDHFHILHEEALAIQKALEKAVANLEEMKSE